MDGDETDAGASDSTPRFDTRAVTAGEPGPGTAPGVEDVVVPIHLTSTYEIPGIDPDAELSGIDPDDGEYIYSRLSNPTRNALENRIASLEGGEYGFAFASGTAAVTAAVMASVEPGDHVVAFEDLYGGTRKMLSGLFRERLNVSVSFVDATETAAVESAIRPETSLLWMETPTNPLLKLCDLRGIAALAADHGVRLGVDNTFASPALQQPLAMGADVVIHSTTKYLNGHSDSIGGALVTNDDAYAEEVGYLQQVAMGSMLSPFDAYVVLRGTKTLPLRVQRHEANAQAVAELFADHDRVERVYYPGLPSHPQHELASEQMDGYGGMVSAEFDADVPALQEFVAALDHFPLAVSLGGVESLVEHPASMTHSELSAAERAEVGISDRLLRFSLGVEHTDDLLEDLSSALDVL
jgi:cystathionine gamma-lyase